MKKCPNCGNLIENDNAKFCKKCGAKLPEIVVDKQKSTAIDSTLNDGILLNVPPKRQITDDGGQQKKSHYPVPLQFQLLRQKKRDSYGR